MREIPHITALMLYYGRKNLAEEAIESFLRQTYPHKHLVIVNTHPDPVWFEGEYPDIEIHNLLVDSFSNLNEKYNYAFRQIKTSWWCPWDSDDLWLPWHFENLVAGIPAERNSTDPMKVGLRTCYFADDNVVTRIGWNMWGNCIYESHDQYGMLYPKCDDSKAQNCDSQILFMPWNRTWLRNRPKSFIFRWDQGPHGSAYKSLGVDVLVHQARCREKMNAIRDANPFRPHWDRDYAQDAEDFNDRMKNETHAHLRP